MSSSNHLESSRRFRSESRNERMDSIESSNPTLDGNQIKETHESDALESQTIYTPPPSSDLLNSDEVFSDKAALLSNEPPKDQEPAPVPVKWSQQDSGKAVPAVEDSRSSYRPKRSRLRLILYSFVAVVIIICNTIQAFRILKGDFSGKSLQDEIGTESPQFRNIVVDTEANPISGTYPLYDLLSLSTTSGNIAVSIDPQAADPSDPLKPARVVIKSQSGSVSVSFSSPAAASVPEFQRKIELDEINKSSNLDALKTYEENVKDKLHRFSSSSNSPSRPYEIDIETASGSVSGRYIFSTTANIRTGSGSISAQLVPIVSLSSNASTSSPENVSLNTSTVSGSTELHVTEPYFTSPRNSESPQNYPRSTDASITSLHTSTGSGSLLISYPQSWAGNVLAASSGHGSIWIGGQGVKIEESRPDLVSGVKNPESEPGDRRWWGSEGAMDVKVKGEGSGAVQFWVGR